MLTKNPQDSGQGDLPQSRLDAIIDLSHELARLARVVWWEGLAEDFRAVRWLAG